MRLGSFYAEELYRYNTVLYLDKCIVLLFLYTAKIGCKL